VLASPVHTRNGVRGFCGARAGACVKVVLVRWLRASVFSRSRASRSARACIHFFIAGCAGACARVLLLSAVGARLGASLMIGEL
jgi:hypothetical protein